MKLILNQRQNISETEVEIRYTELDTTVQKIIQCVEQSTQYICGTDAGRQYRILTNDIFYAESVDRKTFIYTSAEVFRCELKLYQLLNKLGSADFVQISKSCVLNINVLENIKTLLNSKMEGTLTNGEKITISRTYIPNLRAAFAEKEGGSL
ncbi:MAG: LytTR family DNA-binding domain-containing protein [Lachnospiraceae bacterium]